MYREDLCSAFYEEPIPCLLARVIWKAPTPTQSDVDHRLTKPKERPHTLRVHLQNLDKRTPAL